MANGSYSFYLVIGLISLIAGIFFVLRSIIRYKDWSGGDKDEIWSFIALIIGGIDTIIIGIFIIHFVITKSLSLIAPLLGPLMLIGLIPITLFTVYYLLKLEKK